MGSSTIALGLGLGGGKASTSSGRPAGGGGFINAYSLDFDGSDDYMQVGSSGTLGSFSLWFKADSAITKSTTGQYLLSFTANASAWANVAIGSATGYISEELITVNQGNRAYSYESSAGSISTDWHHLAARWTGSTYEIYLDNVQVKNGEAGAGAAGIILFTSLRIAGFTTSLPYAGLLDEVAIWTTPLSVADIGDIYNSGTPTDLTSYSPNNWWRMGDNDSGTGTTITDQGSGSNDGTLTNSPAFSSTVP